MKKKQIIRTSQIPREFREPIKNGVPVFVEKLVAGGVAGYPQGQLIFDGKNFVLINREPIFISLL